MTVLPALSVAVAVQVNVPTPLAVPPVTATLQVSSPEKLSVAVQVAAGAAPSV